MIFDGCRYCTENTNSEHKELLSLCSVRKLFTSNLPMHRAQWRAVGSVNVNNVFAGTYARWATPPSSIETKASWQGLQWSVPWIGCFNYRRRKLKNVLDYYCPKTRIRVWTFCLTNSIRLMNRMSLKRGESLRSWTTSYPMKGFPLHLLSRAFNS